MRAAALAGVAAAVSGAAAGVIDGASFGHNGRISPDQRGIPSWHVSGYGAGWMPELLSDRVVLTPPYPGLKRGALWTENPVTSNQWKVDVEFRASGQDVAGGNNLQLWYTKEGQQEIGSNSLYSVETFEGLAVLVDAGPSGRGEIRAFLNDGKTNFAGTPHLDGLAFGHCSYQYRNLGRPSKITLQQDVEGFQVLVDDYRCFRSDAIQLPTNNYFGVTASSTDVPDSFEVWKFVTSDDAPVPAADQQGRIFGQPQQEQQQPVQRRETQEPTDEQGTVLTADMEDTLASSIRDQEAQFADLHNRLQMLSHSVDKFYREMVRYNGRLHSRLDRMQDKMEQLQQPLAKESQVQMLAKESQVQMLETLIDNKLQQVKKEQRAWTGQFNEIQKVIQTRHDALLDSFPETFGGVLVSHGPNLKLFFFLLAAFQLMLAAAYVVYKRRLSQGPKKYL